MNNLYKNIVILASGAMVGRLIGFVSIPFVTRIYSPEDMGVLTVFLSIITVIGSFTTLRYTVTIPLPRTHGYSLNASILCLILLSIISIAVFIVLYFFSDNLFNFLNITILNDYWYLLPLSVFIIGCSEILTVWAVRYKQFSLISKSSVFQSALGSISKIGLGLISANHLSLIISLILLQMSSVLLLLRFFLKGLSWKKTSIKKIIFIAQYYSDVPKYRLPAQILLNLSSNLPILFFTSFYGTYTAGQIGLALMVLNLPIALIGKTIGQAFYGEIASIGRKNAFQIQKISRGLFKKLICVSFIPFLTLLTFGETLFKITFGPEWVDAGLYASIMSIYIVVNLISAPLVNVLNIFAKNSFYLWINIFRISLLSVVLGASKLYELDIVNTLIAYSVSLSVCYLTITAIIFKLIDDEVLKQSNKQAVFLESKGNIE